MSVAVSLPLVLLASYGLISLILSLAVALAWRPRLSPAITCADEILTVRLLPAALALLIDATVVAPSFLLYEPVDADERCGPVLAGLSVLALVTIIDGARRAWLGRARARTLLRDFKPLKDLSVPAGHRIDVIDTPGPLVAVVGELRPRIVAAKQVVRVCSQEELHQIVAHEAAHIYARDNLKLLLLVASPDPLAWLPTGADLQERWQEAAELEADERASGPDPHKRVALASALIKVARLSIGTGRWRPARRVSEPRGTLDSRIRRLLAPPPAAMVNTSIRRAAVCALTLPVVAVPLHAFVHHIIEMLVAFGR
jgi:hypothetical protein